MVRLNKQQLIPVTTNILFAFANGLYVIANLQNFFFTGSLVSFLIIFPETLLVFIFITRTNAKETSTNYRDWFVAFLGSLITTLLRPTGATDSLVSEILVTLGFFSLIVSYMSLNRSFGYVAALREIKTKNAYSFVRHPIYTSYFLIHIGFIVTNHSMYNIVIMVIFTTVTLYRIHREELLLSHNTSYQKYKTATTYKLFPLIY